MQEIEKESQKQLSQQISDNKNTESMEVEENK